MTAKNENGEARKGTLAANDQESGRSKPACCHQEFQKTGQGPRRQPFRLREGGPGLRGCDETSKLHLEVRRTGPALDEKGEEDEPAKRVHRTKSGTRRTSGPTSGRSALAVRDPFVLKTFRNTGFRNHMAWRKRKGSKQGKGDRVL